MALKTVLIIVTITVEEAVNIEEEGRHAIDSNAQHPVIDALPEEFVLSMLLLSVVMTNFR